MRYGGRKVLKLICEPLPGDEAGKSAHLNKQLNGLAKYAKPVIRISAAGQEKEFNSIKNAAQTTGTTVSAISKCCNGTQQYSMGYSFKFKETK